MNDDWVSMRDLAAEHNVKLLPRPTLRRRVRFWKTELPLRARSWWRRRWWPARIRQLDRERADWKRWYHELAEVSSCLTADCPVCHHPWKNHDPEDGRCDTYPAGHCDPVVVVATLAGQHLARSRD